MSVSVPDYRRFTLAVKLNHVEREALRKLSTQEHLPMAQVVRRLIWQAASREQRQEEHHGQ